MINDRYNGLNFLNNKNGKHKVRLEIETINEWECHEGWLPIETINDREHHGENNNLRE